MDLTPEAIVEVKLVGATLRLLNDDLEKVGGTLAMLTTRQAELVTEIALLKQQLKHKEEIEGRLRVEIRDQRGDIEAAFSKKLNVFIAINTVAMTILAVIALFHK